ncbi:DNA polymerase III subunit delta [Chthonobacter albigriseus]|uniref:DNA polymerase III subunit delta n=1 Tax=Chthonobacter albigriseus TaxID=1683161 RepID=UPI0015EEA0D0|nr:DNA polymerase III subunit delta [Chthonobacter albigriseus]
MVAAKAQDADRIAARPPREIGFYLVYGPDSGSAAERAGRIAAASADPSDPFSLIRLDGAQLTSDPSRLADEAYAVSMFGGRRAILIRDAGGRSNLAAVIAPLIASPPPETVIVVEAGDLKKASPLRALFEKDRGAYAIPCYVDDEAAVARLVDEEVRAHGLSISAEARALLVSQLGGDRLMSRGEIQKVCLFALGKPAIELADVEELIGDSSSIATEEIVDAAATGDLAGLTVLLAKAASEGLSTDQIALSALRHFQALDAARPDVDAGRTPDQAVEGMRPPIFFKRKAKVAKALGLWSAARLQRAMSLLSDTVRDQRLNNALSREIVGDTLITLARYAAGQNRGRR